MPPHATRKESVLQSLASSDQTGLPASQVTAARDRFGWNELATVAPEPAWKKFLAQFSDVVVWILIAAALISGAMGEWTNTAAILAITTFTKEAPMLKHTLLTDEGILILEPSEALETADFEAVIHDMDPYLEEHGSLAGVMIFARAFPGWLNLEAAISHLQLIERFHQKIKRLAIVSDNGLLAALPTFAAHLVHPDVKHFSESEYEEALDWLRSSHS